MCEYFLNLSPKRQCFPALAHHFCHQNHQRKLLCFPAAYYEEQTDEAKKRAANFTSTRIPKFLGYFERILKQNAKSGDFIFDKKAAYVDLSDDSRDCVTLFL